RHRRTTSRRATGHRCRRATVMMLVIAPASSNTRVSPTLLVCLLLSTVFLSGCPDGGDDGDDLAGDMDTVIDVDMSPDQDVPLPDLAGCPDRPEPGLVCCFAGIERPYECDEGMLVCPPGYAWTNSFDCIG